MRAPEIDTSVSWPAGIAFHGVIPEALTAWNDYVIVDQGDGVTLDSDRVSVPDSPDTPGRCVD